MKETEKDKKLKDTLCSWVKITYMIKMFTLFNVFDRFNEDLFKIPMAFFTEINNPKFTWNHKILERTKQSQTKEIKQEASYFVISTYITSLQ